MLKSVFDGLLRFLNNSYWNTPNDSLFNETYKLGYVVFVLALAGTIYFGFRRNGEAMSAYLMSAGVAILLTLTMRDYFLMQVFGNAVIGFTLFGAFSAIVLTMMLSRIYGSGYVFILNSFIGLSVASMLTTIGSYVAFVTGGNAFNISWFAVNDWSWVTNFYFVTAAVITKSIYYIREQLDKKQYNKEVARRTSSN